MAEAQTLINYKSHLISDSGGGGEAVTEEIGEEYERAVYSSTQKFSCGVHIPVRIPVRSPAAEGQVHPGACVCEADTVQPAIHLLPPVFCPRET